MKVLKTIFSYYLWALKSNVVASLGQDLDVLCSIIAPYRVGGRSANKYWTIRIDIRYTTLTVRILRFCLRFSVRCNELTRFFERSYCMSMSDEPREDSCDASRSKFFSTSHLCQSNTEAHWSCFLVADLSAEFYRCVWNSEVLWIKRKSSVDESLFGVSLSWIPTAVYDDYDIYCRAIRTPPKGRRVWGKSFWGGRTFCERSEQKQIAKKPPSHQKIPFGGGRSKIKIPLPKVGGWVSLILGGREKVLW